MMIHLNSSDLITISYYIYNKHKSTLHRNQITDPELLAKHWFPGHQKALDLFYSVIILMPVVLISPILFTSVKLHHSKMADTMIRKVFSFSLSIFLGL